MRIGQGYDVHRLVGNRPLIIGGVEIPHDKGLLGHSDADVLTHAIIDALFGAAALGDLGRHFPDNSGEYKDISSLMLLEKTIDILRNNGYKINNIDSTIVAQAPKMAPFIDEMRQNISKICGCDVGQISIKATTEEGLGFTGAKEGMAAMAICIISLI